MRVKSQMTISIIISVQFLIINIALIESKEHNFSTHEIPSNKTKNQIHLPIHKSAPKYYETPLRNVQQSEYLLFIKFGEQQTPLKVLIDTGSADLWVLDQKCYQCESQLKKFNCEKSFTCQKTQEQLEIEYDDGPIIGLVAYDTVFFEPNILIPKQSFMLVQSADDAMSSTPGIIGLGQSRLATNPHPQVLDHMMNLKMIDEKIFSLYLSNEDQDMNSRLIFGGIDEKYIMKGEQIFYAQLINDFQYSVKIDGLKLSNSKQEYFYKYHQALVDSGSSCIIFPAEFIDTFFDDFKSKFHIDCDLQQEYYAPSFSQMSCTGRIKQFPNITFQINGQNLVIRPQDYIYYCTQDSDDDKEIYNCQMKIEKSVIDDQIILGDGFLQSFYTVFDLKNKQLGFAHSINNNDIQIADDYDDLMFIQQRGLKNERRLKHDQLHQAKKLFTNWAAIITIALSTFFIGYKIIIKRRNRNNSQNIEIITEN